MGAREDREADHVDVLLDGRGGDLLGGETDPLVDDLHADVAGTDGDLLGAVGVAVEAGLGDEDPDPVADRPADLGDALAHRGEQLGIAAGGGAVEPGRAAVGAEDAAQRLRPLAGRDPRLRGLDRRRHQVHGLVLGGGGERREGPFGRRAVAVRLPFLERLDALPLDRGVGREDAAVVADGQGRVLGLGEAVLADHLELAGLDPGEAVAVGLDEARLHVGDGLAGRRAAVLGDDGHLAAGARDQLLDEALHHLRPLEDVGVVEQVGLVGEDLLDPQAPLLVPRAREAERLVPGRQLDRAGAGVAAERDRERLEDDPRDVVLGLRLGQPERVDLDAVAHPQEAGIGDAVALAPELLPEDAHRPQLRVLLDEADPGVDEEADPAEDPREVLRGDLAAVADRVEDGDRVADRVGDLLDRRRSRLLEVVGADVDRVPARDLVDRERDHVGDQPHRRLRRERVGPAREVLLDDVVLGRPLERLARHALLVGDRHVEAEQPCRGGVDRHRGVHLGQRDAVEQRLHVTAMGDRDADLADLAAGEQGIGVVAGLRRQVEGDREAGLALGEVAPVELVRPAGVGVPRVGPHDPGAIALGQAVLAHGRHSRSDPSAAAAAALYGARPCPRPA